MRKTLLAGAATVTMILAPLAISQSSFTRVAAVGESGAMTYDSRRGVLTMAPLLEQTTPAVVNIATSGKARLPRGFQGNEDLFERFFGQQAPQQERNRSSVGSGVIVNSGNGYIMTNHHVVNGADEIYVTLKDRRTLEAEIVGSDPKTDIAVLKVDARNLKALKFADSDEVYVGDYVIAIGNPFGLGQTVTSGIISALGRAGGSSDKYEDFIQTDASINPGNSGGALINSKGELIGINTAIVSRSGGNNGIGFAVPSKMAKGVMSQLVSYGEVRRGRIGVAIQNISPDLMDAMDLSTSDGALVAAPPIKRVSKKAILLSGLTAKISLRPLTSATKSALWNTGRAQTLPMSGMANAAQPVSWSRSSKKIATFWMIKPQRTFRHSKNLTEQKSPISLKISMLAAGMRVSMSPMCAEAPKPFGRGWLRAILSAKSTERRSQI